MTWTQRLNTALHGMVLLYRFDDRAWNFFDFSPRGFWQSFIVAVFLAPLQLGHRLFIYDAEKDGVFAHYAIVEFLSFIVTWTLFPFVMLYIVRLLGRMPRYFAHLIPYLWVQLPMGLVLFGAQALVDAGLLPVALMDSINLVTIAMFAIYGTYVAGIGLQIATGTALSLVVLDYVLGLLVYGIIEKL